MRRVMTTKPAGSASLSFERRIYTVLINSILKSYADHVLSSQVRSHSPDYSAFTAVLFPVI